MAVVASALPAKRFAEGLTKRLTTRATTGMTATSAILKALVRARHCFGLGALGLQAFHHSRRNALGGEALDAVDHGAITALSQRHRQALGASTASAANAVHIVFGLHRQAVVDDVADARHIDAARGHIGGHQHLEVLTAQAIQHPCAAALRHATVQ